MNKLLLKLKLRRNRSNKKSSLLTDFPDVVIKEVLNKLDYQSVLRLRKVSRDLRYSIDKFKPDFQIRRLDFLISPTIISIQTWVGQNQKRDYVDYQKTKFGCRVGWYQGTEPKSRDFENSDFMDMCMRDFEIFLKFQTSTLDILYINPFSFPSSNKNIEDMADLVLERIKTILRNRERLVQVTNFQMKIERQDQAVEILELINPKSINSITIYGKKRGTEISLDELEKLEHWKRAEKLEIRDFDLLWPIANLKRFSTVRLDIRNISIDDLMALKEKFFLSPEPKFFIIESESLKNHQTRIVSKFGQGHYDASRQQGLRMWSWVFKIPNSSSALRIILRAYVTSARPSNIEFCKMDLADIPDEMRMFVI